VKKYILILFVVLFSFSLAQSSDFKAAGFRASRILQSYPNNKFPDAEYWTYVGNSIAGKFQDFSPAGIWIISLYIDNGNTLFNFPSNGLSIPHVSFISSDQNEQYLTKFDQEGIKVWLQVEPGAASVDTLIDIALSRYGNHPCVTGFGVDVEWLDAQSNSGGRKATNAEAERWEKKVKSFDSSYTLFLKHYSQSWMPSTYRGNILFVDDSQDFTFSSSPFNAMVNEFKAWGQSFPKNKVAFQFGYSADEGWWGKLNDPVKTIGDKLIQNVSNCAGLFWVDFTITKLFPVTSVEDETSTKPSFKLEQNYPNPFNPVTTIKYSIPTSPLLPLLTKESVGARLVTLKVYDVLGCEIATLVNEEKKPGSYEVIFNADSSGGGLPSGIYYYQLSVTGGAEESVQCRKMILMK